MLTIAFRIRPGNTEWQYKTVVTRRSPEQWLADRLESVPVGNVPKLEVNVIYAREIDEDAAELLSERLDGRQSG